MNTERLGVVVLGVVCAVLAVYAIFYGIVQAAPTIATVAAAVIAAAAGIIAAIVNHTLTELREQELERNRRMQDNYRMILDKLGEYLREPAAHRDKIASANLLSWVVASPAVVMKTIQLLKIEEEKPQTTDKAEVLKELLLLMRQDLGMSEDKLKDASVSVKGLFPAKMMSGV